MNTPTLKSILAVALSEILRHQAGQANPNVKTAETLKHLAAGQLSQADVQDQLRGMVNQDTIFISYARRDWDTYAAPMVLGLAQYGKTFWVDRGLVRAGDDWQDEINHALKVCGKMILIVTQTALNSRFVKGEYRYFLNHKPGKLYPILCEPDVELPPELDSVQYTPFSELPNLVEGI